jgi:hypothetical protein
MPRTGSYGPGGSLRPMGIASGSAFSSVRAQSNFNRTVRIRALGIERPQSTDTYLPTANSFLRGRGTCTENALLSAWPPPPRRRAAPPLLPFPLPVTSPTTTTTTTTTSRLSLAHQTARGGDERQWRWWASSRCRAPTTSTWPVRASRFSSGSELRFRFRRFHLPAVSVYMSVQRCGGSG